LKALKGATERPLHDRFLAARMMARSQARALIDVKRAPTGRSRRLEW
jgi:hypothetical protein